MALRDFLIVRASAAATATGQSAAQRLDAGDELSIELDVTAVTGTTPSLTLSIEWSHDGVNWFQADPPDVFTAVTTAGKRIKEFDVKGAFYRVVWTITGTTPSFTAAINAWVN